MNFLALPCRILVWLLAFALAAQVTRAAEAPLRVLIFSGQNNHDWKTTTPKIQDILASSGRFSVEVTELPGQFDAAAGAKHDVVLSNWNAWGKNPDIWPESARKAYIDFIRGGKGLVIVHAGSSSFYDWEEYQQAAGASWKLGQTGHGKPHGFRVEAADPQHPVMRGLAPFLTTDELWRKPGVHPGAKVLASGDGEPVALATELGKGRGFTLLLGHSAAFMENEGFQALLLRGTEWAATGEVTLGPQPPVDPDAVLASVARYRFGADRESVRKLERLAQAASTGPAARKALAEKLLALAASPSATMEGRRQALWFLSLVAGPEDASAIRKLLDDKELNYFAQNALARLDAPRAWKNPAAMQAESEAAARALASTPGALFSMLSGNDRTRQAAALRAFRAYPDPDALKAVVAQFDQLPAAVQPQIVALLGDLATPAGLPVLAKAAASADPLLRQTAFIALGQAGNASIIPALLVALETAPGDERRLIAESLIRLPGEGVDEALAAAFSKSAPAVQRELVRALAAREARGAIPALLAVAGSSDAGLRAEAGAAIGRLGDIRLCSALIAMIESSPDGAGAALAAICRREGSVQPLLEAMAGAPPPKQALLLAVLGSTGGPQALDSLYAATKSEDGGVRVAAVRALAAWNGAEAFDVLVALTAAAGDPAGRTLAARGVARLAPQVSDRSPGQLAETLAAVLERAAVNEKKALLGALGKIGGPAALKVVEGCANDPALAAEARAAAEQIQGAARAGSAGKKRLGAASEGQMKLFDAPGNLVRLGAKATSPTGLQSDGHGDVPAAAIDGDGGTYWDEVDRQPLYRFRVQLAEPARVGLLRILGFQHENYAPKTFEILCDDKAVKTIVDARYEDNVLSVELPPTECRNVELKITGSYGASPAIRELGLFPASQ